MNFVQEFALKVKRSETPFYARVKRVAIALKRLRVPVPRPLFPLLRGFYQVHFGVADLIRRLIAMFYREPLFRSRCVSVGSGLYLEQLPNITGHTEIHIGESVTISGDLRISSGRVLDHPELIIGDRVFLGHRTLIVVGRRVVIEDDVGIAAECYIADNDGHDTRAGRRGAPAPPEEIQEIRICKGAWIGRGCSIMKGVTIGEGAIVGIGSVVISDIPPHAVAFGNPARVIRRSG